MSRENGTKWVTLHNEEDDDEVVSSALEPLDGVDESEQMQEGRRVLGLAMAPPNKHVESIMAPGALTRLLCTSVFVAIFCLLFGVLIGYLATSSRPQSTACPSSDTSGLVSSTTTTTLLPVQTTTTTIPTTTQKTESLEAMASHLLSHLSPNLIREYIQNISSVRADYVDTVIKNSFVNLGYEVMPVTFKSMMSLSDSSNLNLVEIVFVDNSSKLINNATHSLENMNAFSAWSPNGTFSGNLVYGHFARREDFETLEANNVSVSDSILLVRNGELHPSIQVRNAEKAGAKGVLLFPDPFDFKGSDPETTVFPDGSALPLDAVLMQGLRLDPGDPSTPDMASNSYSFRIPPQNYTGVPSILVQPVSSETGRTLLALLGGPQAPDEWKTSLISSLFLGGNFKENVSAVRMTVNNFIAEESTSVLKASLPTNGASITLHIGCRYESRGGNLTSSGLSLAVLLSLASAFKNTFPQGTPREVVFTAFEAPDGDYSSGTEYSQLYSSWLESTAMAYLDLDSLLSGTGYVEARVSPLLRDVTREALQHVSWPEGEALNVMQGLTRAHVDIENPESSQEAEELQTSFKYLNPPTCDGALNFQALHGIPTIRLSSVNIRKKSKYALKGSQYDTIDAIVQTVDKNLHWTHMIASLMGVVSLALATSPLPLIRFDDLCYDLKKGWNGFLTDSNHQISRSQPQTQALIGAINGELDKLMLSLDAHSEWYKQEKQKVFIDEKVKLRVNSILQISRRFLRPRKVAPMDVFGSCLTFGPDPDGDCDGAYFPFLKEAVKGLEANQSGAAVVFTRELSVLHGVLVSFNLNLPLTDS